MCPKQVDFFLNSDVVEGKNFFKEGAFLSGHLGVLQKENRQAVL